MSNKKVILSVILFLLCYVAFAFLPNTSDPEEIGKIIETSTRFIDIDGEYEKGEVLIKYELGPSVSLSFGKSFDAKMKQQLEEAGVIDYVKLGATNKALGSTKLSQTESTYVWVRGYIDKNLTVIDVLANLGAITQVSHAEPNYKYYSTEEGAVEEVIDPLVSEQTYLNEINIDAARDHLESLGINPGGSRDVVVAVIDTGVDYLHEDLAPNMWVNTQEIAGNGIDDDQNGFIDDIYGVSTVSDEWFHHGNPMDDHGHGTHVAGIIAAKGGNGVGIEGVASNVRIMAIKASASSGIFLSSDIAEGVSYAYEKGADVINMSFGGYSKSYIVEDALAIAFSKAVLVAAAGNDAQINEPHPQGRDMFPAAYPWVVGVMASNGNSLASFSNFDYWPEDAHEYSITAPGTYMMSTLPNNKYAKWSGTSMSTPVVSGVAALLRSKFTDSGHNSRFIMGQLIGTSQTPIFIPEYYKLAYGVRWQTYFQVDAFNALTEVPKPNLTFYDYYVWDAEEVEATNQVNGYVDSGELIELGLYIRNHWGQARDVTVSINAISPGGVPDPYIEFITDTVNYGQVGSFSTDDNGFEYNEEDRVVGITNPFVIRVSPDTPNDYVVRINIVISGYNALDPLDETEYINDKQSFTLTVRNGYILPNLIDEDMVLTNDKYYIIPNATRIEDGVTVTVEEGTKIQFWSGQPEDPYADKPIAYLRVDGKLFFKGTKEKPIKIFPSEIMESYEVYIYKGDSNAEIHMEYTEVANPRLNVTTISHGYFYQNTENFIRRGLSQGVVYDSYWDCPYVSATYIDASIFWKLGNTYASNKFSLDGYVTNSLFDSNFMQFTAKGENNVFLNNFIRDMGYYQDRLFVSSAMTPYYSETVQMSVSKIFRDEVTGTSYIQVDGFNQFELAQRFARYLGGHLAVINSDRENDFIRRNINSSVTIGLVWESPNLGYQWINGDELTYTNWSGNEASSFTPHVNINNLGFWNQGRTNQYLIELTGDIYINDIVLEKANIVLGNDSEPYQVVYDLVPTTANVNDLEWFSMNENIVTVDQNGVITPIALGQTTVLVRSKDGVISKDISVSIIETVPLLGVTLSGVTQLNVDQTYKIPYTLEPFNTTELSFNWTSSDETLATVDSVGKVTAHHPGVVKIHVSNKDGSITDEITFNIVSPVKSLSFDQNYLITWENRDPLLLNVNILPEDATNKTIIYESAAPDIAYVDADGYLHAVSNGSVVIRATAQHTNIYTELIVTVTDEQIANLKFVDVDTIGWGEYLRFYALSDQGTVWHWGREEIRLPKQESGLENIIDMSLSYDDGYFLSSDAKVYLVYPNWQGNQIESFDLPFTDAVQIERQSYNNEDYLLIRRSDGTVWGLGNNTNGELPGIYIEHASEFVQLDVSGIIDMVALRRASIYLNQDGTVHYSGLPDSPSGIKMIPDLSNIVSIEYYHSWDRNIFVATDSYNNHYRVYVNESYVQFDKIIYNNISKTVVQYADNSYHRLMITEDGRVYSSGQNNYGQLGTGNTISYWYDYADIGLNNVKKVIPTYYNSIALTNEGRIYVWGINYQNNIGNLTGYNHTSPAQPLIGFEYDTYGPVSDGSNIHDVIDFKVTDSIIIDFSEAIKTHTNFMSIKLVDENNNPISIQRTIALDKLIIKPVVNLRYDETYTLIISDSAIQDYFSNPNGYQQYVFKTEDGIDFTRENYRIDINDQPVQIEYTTTPNWTESLTYESTNPEVATVDGLGFITPVALGQAVIIVKSESGQYTWMINVNIIERVLITSLDIEQTDFSMVKGNTQRLNLNVSPLNYNEDIIWTSSDTSVAKVDEYGFVTGLKDGTVTITATSLSGLYTDSIVVTVIEPVEEVIVDQEIAIVNLIDATYQINASVIPLTATDQTINYQSSNGAIATVDQTGLVTILQSGQVVIRAISYSSNVYKDVLLTIPEEDISQVEFVDIVSAGGSENLTVYGLTHQGDVYVWGQYNERTPVKMTTISNVVKMEANSDRVIFVTSSGQAYYTYRHWGYNNMNVLTNDVNNIIDVSSFDNYDNFKIILKNDGTVWGQGNNNYGQLTGIGLSYLEQFTQLQGISNIVEIQALRNISVFLNEDGQVLYSGGPTSTSVATQVLGLPQISSIERKGILWGDTQRLIAKDVNGDYHEIYFGNENGELVITKINLTSIPGQIVSYKANDYYEMVVNDLGDVYARGNNHQGQFGNGEISNYYSNVFEKTNVTGVKEIFTERTSSFAIDINGKLLSWGNNNYGALGLYHSQLMTEPRKVLFGFVSDNENPEIINQYPVNDTYNFKVNDNIVITFGEKIAEAYNIVNIKLYDSNNTQVSLNIKVTINQIIIDPVGSLKYGEPYKLVLANGAVVDYFGSPNNYREILFETEVGVNFERFNYRLDIEDLPTQIGYTPNEKWTEELTFTSSNPEIATVDQNGMITPVSLGVTDIIVSDQSGVYSWTIHVEVIDRVMVESLDIIEETLIISTNETKRIGTTITPYNYNEDIIWTTSDASIATVDEFGFVKGIADGTVTITATTYIGQIIDQVIVSVIEPVVSVSIENEFIVYNLNDDPLMIDVSIYPETATHQNIIWESGNPEIGYIDEFGYLQALQKGTVIVRGTVEYTDLFIEAVISITDEISNNTEFVDVGVMGYEDNMRVFALTNDGNIWYWGNENAFLPQRIPNLSNVVEISFSSWTGYALTSNGDVYQISTNGTTNSVYKINSNVDQIISVSNNSYSYDKQLLVRSDGTVWAKGSNQFNELGTNTFDYTSQFVQIDGLSNIKESIALVYTTVHLTNDGELYYLGRPGDQMTPQLIENLPLIKDIKRAGMTHYGLRTVIAESIDGDFFRFYFEDFSNYQFELIPTTINGEDVIDYSTQMHHNYFLVTEMGKLYAKGNNDYGQLGINSTENVESYTLVDLEDVSKVFAFGNNTAAITNSGSLYIWGRNSSNQIGDLTTENRLTPFLALVGLNMDEEHPYIESISPTNQSINVPVDAKISIDFSEGVRASQNYSMMQLFDANGKLVSIKKELALDKLYITPIVPLRYGETYTFVMQQNSVMDYFMNGNEATQITFETQQGITFNRTNYRIDISNTTTQVTYQQNSVWDQSLIFTSLDETIFTVDQTGIITPVSLGIAQLKVASEDGLYEWMIQIEIIEIIPITGIEIIETEITTSTNLMNERIEVNVSPVNYNEDIVWSSSDETVVLVDEFGFITPLQNGTATITVSSMSGLYSDTVLVTVIEPVDYIDFDQSETVISLAEGTKQLTVNIYPETATNKNILWQSANSDIVSIDETGLITVHQVGIAVIRAKAEYTDIYADLIIHVTDMDLSTLSFVDVITVGEGGSQRFYALTDAGEVWYWGMQGGEIPKKLSLVNVVKMESGYEYGWFITGDDKLYKVLHNGSYTPTVELFDTPVTGISDVSSSSYDIYDHTLVVKTDGTVWGLGNNEFGQLAGVPYDNVDGFVQLEGLLNIKQAIALYQTSVYLNTSGQVLYSGNPGSKTNAIVVSGLANIVSIETYENYHSYQKQVIAKDANNVYYQVYFDGNIPVVKTVNLDQFPNAKAYAEVQDQHEFVITENNELYAQGYNYHGELGNATRTNSYYSYVKTRIEDVVKVIPTRYNSVAITSAGEIYVWGYNSYYQVTGSSNYYQTTPIKVLIGKQTINSGPSVLSVGPNHDGLLKVDDQIVVKFDRAVYAANQFANIKLYDYQGNQISMTKSINFNEIVITPLSELRYGETYQLYIPSNSVSAFGYGNSGSSHELKVEKAISFERTTYRIDINDLPTELGYTLNPEFTSNILFESNNIEAVTIDENGLMTPVAMGNATIKVYTEDGKYQWFIDVEIIHRIPVESIDILESSVVINKGQTERADIIVTPAEYNEDLVWSSSDEAVATVDEFGIITGHMNGTVTITVQSLSGLYNDTISVTVIEPVESLSYGEQMVLMTINDDPLAISLDVNPSTATNKNIIWRSSNENVAYFDLQGKLTPRSVGTIMIRGQAEYSDVYIELIVSVSESLTDMPNVVDVATLEYDNQHAVFAVTDTGELWTWGQGWLGRGSSNDKAPAPVKLNVTDVKAVESYPSNNRVSIIKNDGTVWSIGYYYAAGNGNWTSYTFEKADYITDIIDIKVGPEHTLALKSDGTVWAWGGNSYGQLGDGSTNERQRPVQVNGIENAVDIYVAHITSYVITADGTVYEFGYNSENVPTVNEYLSSLNIKTMSVRPNHHNLYVLTQDNKVYDYFPGNANANIMSMTLDTHLTIEDIAYGYDHLMLKMSDGTIRISGRNQEGQLGHGIEIDYVDRYYPVTPMIENASMIYAGFYNSLMINTSGELFIWGDNRSGQLADFTLTNSYLPKKVFFGSIADSFAPEIVQTTPANLQTEVGLSNSITIQFDEAIRSTSNFSTIYLFDPNNNIVSVQKDITWDTLTIDPTVDLNPLTTYHLYIPNNAIMDVFGNNFGSLEIMFTTEDITTGLATEIPEAVNDRHYWTNLEVTDEFSNFTLEGHNASFYNNAILNNIFDLNTDHWMRFFTQETDSVHYYTNNYWGTSDEFLVNKQVIDFNDYQSYSEIKVDPYLTEGNEMMYPFVTDVLVSNSTEADARIVGAEPITITVLFNRDMDMTQQLRVFFGPDYPFTDYQVPGSWTDARTWVGNIEITPLTGDGKQYFRIRDAYAADDTFMWMGDDDARFMFEINSFGAEAMALQATGGEGAVELSWIQDEFDTLAGYNMYRSTSLNGEFSKINETLIPSDTLAYSDYNVEPGMAYYYKFTIVKTDLTESSFSNVAFASAYDLIPPQVFHTPIFNSNTGQDILISATAIDNIGITSMILYYRAIGAETYKSIDMLLGSNNRYTGTISSTDAVVPGIEYYIEVSDGRTTVYSGTEGLPHKINIEDNPTITAITPNRGLYSGGTEVTISGINFKTGAKVYFSNVEGLFVNVVDENTLTVQTPAINPQKVNVKVENPDGSSHIIYNGFEYYNDDSKIMIANTTVAKGDDVTIPIRVENAKGLLALDVDITYDTNALAYSSLALTTMTSRFAMAVNASTPGVIKVSIASDTAISGSGDILMLKFGTYTNAPDQTNVEVTKVNANSINDGMGIINGVVTFASVYQFEGSVTYFGNGDYVPGVSVKLYNNDVMYENSSSLLDGTYSFNGIGTGMYEISAEKEGQYSSITAYDASMILRHVVEIETITNQYQLIAADVNEDGYINSMDASYILQFLVGMQTLPFEGSSSAWKFIYPQTTYDVQSSKYNQNIIAILLGDVSGNFNPTSALSTEHQGVISVGQLEEIENDISVPIYIDYYDYELYSFETTIIIGEGTQVKDIFISSQLDGAFTMFNQIDEHTIKVAVASSSPLILEEPVLEVVISKTVDALDSVHFRLANTMLNEYDQIVEVNNVYRFVYDFDINDNGVIDDQDIINFILNYNQSYEYVDISYYDINRDGVVDIYDIIAVRHRI